MPRASTESSEQSRPGRNNLKIKTSVQNNQHLISEFHVEINGGWSKLLDEAILGAWLRESLARIASDRGCGVQVLVEDRPEHLRDL